MGDSLALWEVLLLASIPLVVALWFARWQESGR